MVKPQLIYISKRKELSEADQITGLASYFTPTPLVDLGYNPETMGHICDGETQTCPLLQRNFLTPIR